MLKRSDGESGRPKVVFKIRKTFYLEYPRPALS